MNRQPIRLNPSLALESIRQALGHEYESVRVTRADFEVLMAHREKPHTYYIAAYINKNPIILSFKADRRTAVGVGRNAVNQLRQNKISAWFLAVMPVDTEETLIYKRIFEEVRPQPELKPGPAPVKIKQQEHKPKYLSLDAARKILERLVGTRGKAACHA